MQYSQKNSEFLIYMQNTIMYTIKTTVTYSFNMLHVAFFESQIYVNVLKLVFFLFLAVCGDGCLNGGTCLSNYYGVVCACPEGYLGPRCEQGEYKARVVVRISQIS